MEERGFSVEVTLRDGYEFGVDFGMDGVDALTVDEPPPLGEGAGPNPARLLAAAVGSCMSASLLFCARRGRVPVEGIRTTVEGTLVRNETGRLRIGGLKVRLHPALGEDADRWTRCLEVFEDYCIVGQSVRDGIPLDVEVVPAAPAAEAALAAAAGVADGAVTTLD